MPEEIMKQNQIYIITSQDIISLREEYALEVLVAHLKSLIFFTRRIVNLRFMLDGP